MFVEKYSPYLKNGRLLTHKNQLNIMPVLTLAAALGIITMIVVTAEPYWLTMLVFPLMSVVCEGKSFNLLRKKRVPGEVVTVDFRHRQWYDQSELGNFPIYDNAVLEYLDYLRSGGEQNKYIEQNLRILLENLIEEYERGKEQEERTIAEAILSDEQLEMYKEILSDRKRTTGQLGL